MTNIEIAWIFNEIADLLELAGENFYKVLAYRKASRSLQRINAEVADLQREGRLSDVPGIGKNLRSKIEEILKTGKCTYLEELRRNVPQGMRYMLAIPGLGPSSIRLIYQKLSVETLEELEKAAKKKKIRELPGMGPKTETNILEGIKMLKSIQDCVPLGVALPLAELMVSQLTSIQGVKRAEICGEIRRGKEMVADIDLLVAATSPRDVIDIFLSHPRFKESWVSGAFQATAISLLGVKVNLKVVSPEEFAAAWFYYSSSGRHIDKLNEIAANQKYKIISKGFKSEKEKENGIIMPESEEEAYGFLGLPYIPPELREGSGEIEAAIANSIPKLITAENIRGDLHIHTNWSDGLNTIEEMAEAALKRGYEYIAITDHSRSLSVADGLSVEKLIKQFEVIKELNKKMSGFRILSGIEVDIRTDGTLDYPDEVLAMADIVVASVHSGFKQDSATINLRVQRALENPYVRILGHPSGRILGRRDPYALDLEQILETASRKGTWLEINSSPDRLDLSSYWARKAKEKGVVIAINTDAHDVSRLDDIRFGIITGRRGWLESENVINTWPLDKLLTELGGMF